MEVGLRAEQAAKIYGEILERLVFKHSFSELSRIIGEKASASLIFRVVKSSMREAVEEILPKGLVENPLDGLLLCYRLFALAGQEFGYEVENENTVRVTKCPHYRFTRENPVACAACAATKAGALEALTGKKVAVELENGAWLGPRDAEIVVKRTSHMPSGDPYCRFVLHGREGTG
jgi:predicted hydrocarbon binding protein